MKTTVARVMDVRKHPDADRLTIVTVMVDEDSQIFEVVANLGEHGAPRWEAGETCVYVPENSVVPANVLQERGYWDEVKNKGLLGGSKGNRVKMQRFAGFESRGLLFKVVYLHGFGDIPFIVNGNERSSVSDWEDVSEFFGITEWVPQ